MLRSNILKLALFATGLSGIVAEYILSTLATYLLGDSVLQWTMIISVMMFSMGLGSRLSRHFKKNLLTVFVVIEIALSVFVSFSALLSYTVASFSVYVGIVIYTMCIIIGTLIGMEIPLVVRLNDEFETLRVNVSSVIEKDYYGSLLGGVFFAFVGLPYLGLTYTPFILGFVNLFIAMLLVVFLRKGLDTKHRKWLMSGSAIVAALIVTGAATAKPVVMYGEQKKYKDLIVYEEQSQYQRIVITEWKNDYWLYLNGNQQLSTLDEVMYHEPLVHPVMQLAKVPKDVLVLGGGDGCAVREILKYESVRDIDLVDLDPAVTKLAKEHEVLTTLNQNALFDSKVSITNIDGYKYLDTTRAYYDVIIIDLPDPRTVELGRLYSQEFYKLCHKHLRPNGVIITQAGSPYFATQAYLCVNETMKAAGFATAPLHNHVITLGEWGWILGSKQSNEAQLKKDLLALEFDNIPTQWINNESMKLMTSFGKSIHPGANEQVIINKVHDPVLYKYYLNGNWDLY